MCGFKTYALKLLKFAIFTALKLPPLRTDVGMQYQLKYHNLIQIFFSAAIFVAICLIFI